MSAVPPGPASASPESVTQTFLPFNWLPSFIQYTMRPVATSYFQQTGKGVCRVPFAAA